MVSVVQKSGRSVDFDPSIPIASYDTTSTRKRTTTMNATVQSSTQKITALKRGETCATLTTTRNGKREGLIRSPYMVATSFPPSDCDRAGQGGDNRTTRREMASSFSNANSFPLIFAIALMWSMMPWFLVSIAKYMRMFRPAFWSRSSAKLL